MADAAGAHGTDSRVPIASPCRRVERSDSATCATAPVLLTRDVLREKHQFGVGVDTNFGQTISLLRQPSTIPLRLQGGFARLFDLV